MDNKTNLRDFNPPAPGEMDYMQAVKSTATMPAISPGTNDMEEYRTGAQPKDKLGGEAKFE